MSAPYYRPDEVAAIIGVPEAWVASAADNDVVPCFKPSRRFVRFDGRGIEFMRNSGVPCKVTRSKRAKPYVGTEQVYFIADAANRAVKIGKAIDVEQRLRDLQCANPFPLKVIGVTTGPRGEERRFHAKHADDRIRANGEWFVATPRVLRSAVGCLAHPDDVGVR